MFPRISSPVAALFAIANLSSALTVDPVDSWFSDAVLAESSLLQTSFTPARGAGTLLAETAHSAESPAAASAATSFPAQLRWSTVAASLVFGGVAVAWALLEVASLAEQAAAPKTGKRSEAYVRELRFLRSASAFGGIICLCYACEHFPVFPHAEKVHSLWLYFGSSALVLFAALFTVQQSQTDEPLAREQTEEWKGWLQVVFLLYHYFNAHEVYVPIRVFVSCYVWMTGFGNYLFFARKADFGLVRVLQMLWRMNAAVLALCCVLGNPYILYYICPLHTFYFLLTYTVMALKPSWNQDAKLMSFKLLVAAALIFAVWDAPFGLFGRLFGWLDTEPLGTSAPFGTRFEWYFRSSVDHYSALFGMLSAHCLPHFVAWLRHVEAQTPSTALAAKSAIGLLMMCGLCIWWFGIGSVPKSSYVPLHAYTCWMPILVYVALRNLCAPFRRYHMALFREIGTTSLETYLLQHHLWLTSNAKSWLVLIPAFPAVNAIATTILFVAASRALFRSTLVLREVFLPDSLVACARNLGLLAVGAALASVGAWTLLAHQAGPLVLLATVLGSGALCAATILRHTVLRSHAASSPQEGSGVSQVWTSAFVVALVLLITSPAGAWIAASRASTVVGLDRWGDASGQVWRGPTKCAEAGNLPPSLPRDGPGGSANMADCCDSASPGGWSQSEGSSPAAWEWQATPVQCHFNTMGFRNEFCGRDVVFAGDSTVRSVYFAFAELLGEDAQPENGDKHSDRSIVRSAPCNGFRPSAGGRLSFLWRPFAGDLLAVAQNESLADVPLVLSSGLWDALHAPERGGISSYRTEMTKLRSTLAGRPAPAVWMTTTAVQDSALNSEEKQMRMTDEQLDPYRAEALAVVPAFAAILDAHEMTAPAAAMGEAPDGVHYPSAIQGLLGEAVARILSATLPPRDVRLPARELNGLTSPLLGGGVFLFVMVAAFVSTWASFTSCPMKTPLASAPLADVSVPEDPASHALLPPSCDEEVSVAAEDKS